MPASRQLGVREGLHSERVVAIDRPLLFSIHTAADSVRMRCPWVTARSQEPPAGLVLPLHKVSPSQPPGQRPLLPLRVSRRQPSGLNQKPKTQETFLLSPLAAGPPSFCLEKQAMAKFRLRSKGSEACLRWGRSQGSRGLPEEGPCRYTREGKGGRTQPVICPGTRGHQAGKGHHQ